MQAAICVLTILICGYAIYRLMRVAIGLPTHEQRRPFILGATVAAGIGMLALMALAPPA